MRDSGLLSNLTPESQAQREQREQEMLRAILSRNTARQLPQISRLDRSSKKGRVPKFSVLKPFRGEMCRSMVVDTSLVYPPPRIGSDRIREYRETLSRGKPTYSTTDDEQFNILPARRRLQQRRDLDTETKKQISLSERLDKLDNDVEIVLERIRTASRRTHQSSRGSSRPGTSSDTNRTSSSRHSHHENEDSQRHTMNFDEIERQREREVENTLTQLPKRNIMTSLRKILGIVAHVTDKKVLRNWSTLKYGFIVHVNSRWNPETWKIRCDDIRNLFASFRGSDAFRSGDMSRILRLLEIHKSKDEDLVGYVAYCFLSLSLFSTYICLFRYIYLLLSLSLSLNPTHPPTHTHTHTDTHNSHNVSHKEEVNPQM